MACFGPCIRLKNGPIQSFKFVSFIQSLSANLGQSIVFPMMDWTYCINTTVPIIFNIRPHMTSLSTNTEGLWLVLGHAFGSRTDPSKASNLYPLSSPRVPIKVSQCNMSDDGLDKMHLILQCPLSSIFDLNHHLGRWIDQPHDSYNKPNAPKKLGSISKQISCYQIEWISSKPEPTLPSIVGR